jgi:Uncharacterized homolog of gamma-carboxymuconolactone decarboxylase subunit
MGMLAAAGCGGLAAGQAVGAEDDRTGRGLAILGRVAGGDPLRALRTVEALVPDLARLTVEFAYGDVVARPGLGLVDREFVTVAMLMALGSATPQMHFHMAGFLNVGGSPEDLVELPLLAVPVLGFPASIAAIAGMRRLFAERGVSVQAPRNPEGDRMARGRAAADALKSGAAESHPVLARWRMAVQYGEVLSRGVLAPRRKILAMIAMLAAVGGRGEALREELAGALRFGVALPELLEVLIQVAVYAGFPAALNGVSALVAAQGAAPVRNGAVPAAEGDRRAERLSRGLDVLARTSAAAGEAVVRGFDDTAPDIGRLIVEHSYGEVFSRPGIDARTRELCALSALAAIGSDATLTPLKVHARAALNAGAKGDEIDEVLLNLAPYVGFPPVGKALAAVGDIVAERRTP